MALESNTKLLEELETLSSSLCQSHISATRRTVSLALPRSSAPPIPTPDEADTATIDYSKPKSKARRMSLSPWRSRTKEDDAQNQQKKVKRDVELFDQDDTSSKDKRESGNGSQ
ncbi:unnamed protein product [Amaranthus hypochondriacus]